MLYIYTQIYLSDTDQNNTQKSVLNPPKRVQWDSSDSNAYLASLLGLLTQKTYSKTSKSNMKWKLGDETFFEIFIMEKATTKYRRFFVAAAVFVFISQSFCFSWFLFWIWFHCFFLLLIHRLYSILFVGKSRAHFVYILVVVVAAIAVFRLAAPSVLLNIVWDSVARRSHGERARLPR